MSSPVTVLLRGSLYEREGDDHMWLVVSNNQRNRARESALVLMLTTSMKPPLSSVAVIPTGEQVVGRLVADDLETLYLEDDVTERKAGLSPATMRLVDQALRSALALS